MKFTTAPAWCTVHDNVANGQIMPRSTLLRKSEDVVGNRPCIVTAIYNLDRIALKP